MRAGADVYVMFIINGLLKFHFHCINKKNQKNDFVKEFTFKTNFQKFSCIIS